MLISTVLTERSHSAARGASRRRGLARAVRIAAGLAAALALCARTSTAQTLTVSGFVEDAGTGERLVGATVFDEHRAAGTTTNAYGFFALTLRANTARPDSIRLVIRYVGYAPFRDVRPWGGGRSIYRLTPEMDSVGAVTVVAEAYRPHPGGEVQLSAREIRRSPALLGEPDALKVLQLLPGVHAGSEGSSGLHVRGGSPDQTLLLLDGAPVYNAAHLFGSFSVFNTEALQSVRLFKGGLPARYGGRLSSVVDVTMREGSRARLGGSATVGLLASGLTVEGPLGQGRGAFIVSGRRTYADVLARPLLHRPGSAVGYWFHDVNAKASYDLGEGSRLFASVYAGQDRLYSRSSEALFGGTDAQRAGLGWGNVTGTIRATRVLSPRLFASALALYSRYDFGVESENSRTYPAGAGVPRSFFFAQRSGLHDSTFRLDVEAAPLDGHAVQFGASASARRFTPVLAEHRSVEGGDSSATAARDDVPTFDGSVYAEDEMRLGRRVRLAAGLHAAVLHVRAATFWSVQPRVRAAVEAGRGWTVVAAAERTWQPLHLLTNSGIGLPTDLWVPATDRVGPERALQASLGAARRFAGDWELALDGFAKRMEGLVEYRSEGGFVASGERWEDAVTTGSGWAEGVELLVRKTAGRLQGWGSYSLSRSRRRFPEIDGGRAYPYRYDRTHDLAVVAAYSLTARRRASATWVYGTGAAVTLPVAHYDQYPHYHTAYGPRNGSRFPAYHRLDLAYEIRYGRGTLSVGAYNAYNRLNPYYIELGEREFVDPQTGEARGVDVFKHVGLFPALPFVSYRRSF